MLTIKNYKRLKGTVIGSTGYYVDNILPATHILDLNGAHKHIYKIELTNRKQVLMLQLNREGFEVDTGLKLYELTLGKNYININKFQLRNMDYVISIISKLLLEQFIP